MASVFVTVGTTKFDELIRQVCSREVVESLLSLGYSKLTMQIGHGSYEPDIEQLDSYGITAEYYRRKPSLTADIKGAKLVISHAGAGCITETLEAQRPLVVVINEDLMGNHQVELAKQLNQDRHLLYTNCSGLNQMLKDMDLSILKPYESGKPAIFAQYLDKVMGIS